MAKSFTRTYSRYSSDATRLLGLMLRTARIEHKLTVEELAERAGVSRGLVYRAEQGDMGCAIGVVFELAAIVGISLFTPDHLSMTLHTANAEKTLSLLPRAVRHPKKIINDDF
ncbi:helix-turn-helix domain-containing protein [Morganella psychrotolerans]|uniref:Helix-turn-helix transcriptional regulator n=1 Tax=Morganella psychrotolerans TaxID=368603 RepID=A0A5M9R5X8_9GAMM|nr:helix-turn-helix transcriptional regulator [Morganella psychrotolerans]KAA8715326.1 helix-turn-helix transcriptional regulator [Morganella psychrotolerans]OBU05750.1 transcriptional regulator [Morganella psychrotolerans]